MVLTSFKVIMLIMGKAKPPEVVETSGGFCSVYVRGVIL